MTQAPIKAAPLTLCRISFSPSDSSESSVPFFLSDYAFSSKNSHTSRNQPPPQWEFLPRPDVDWPEAARAISGGRKESQRFFDLPPLFTKQEGLDFSQHPKRSQTGYPFQPLWLVIWARGLCWFELRRSRQTNNIGELENRSWVCHRN